MKYHCVETDAVIELVTGRDKLMICDSGGDAAKTVVGLDDLYSALILFGVTLASVLPYCPFCGHKKEFKVSTDSNSGRVCKNMICNPRPPII